MMRRKGIPNRAGCRFSLDWSGDGLMGFEENGIWWFSLVVVGATVIAGVDKNDCLFRMPFRCAPLSIRRCPIIRVTSSISFLFHIAASTN
jgi:hypothetical protein